jgi:hypothetical protein
LCSRERVKSKSHIKIIIDIIGKVMNTFSRYVGIDYSGARAPVSRLPGIQVYECVSDSQPSRVLPYDFKARNWSRKEVAKYMREVLLSGEQVIIGLDHGFSFPESYFLDNTLPDWDTFLKYFSSEWPTNKDHMYVDFIRKDGRETGDPPDLRLCEKWTTGAKSVFQFDVQGSVAKSTFAGLSWLADLRNDKGIKSITHFWPFDGFSVPSGKSIVGEVYPSLFRRRYPRGERTSDEQDAYAVSRWLQEMDRRGALQDCLNPPLTLPERRQVMLEGWIMGVR